MYCDLTYLTIIATIADTWCSMLGASWTRNWLFSDWIWIIERNKIFLICCDQTKTHPSLKSGVIRVPWDDRDPQISRQLEEVLRSCCCPAEMFTNILLCYNQEILRKLLKKNGLSQLQQTVKIHCRFPLHKFPNCCFPKFDQRYEDHLFFLLKNICCLIITCLSCRLLLSRCYPGKFRTDFLEWLKTHEMWCILTYERINNLI